MGVHCFKISRCCEKVVLCLPNCSFFTSLTHFLSPSHLSNTFAFHSVISLSLSSPPLSLGKQRMMKSLNEMPPQLQQKIQLVRREILRTKCNTAKRKKSIKCSKMCLISQPCFPPQLRLVSPPFPVWPANLTNCEFSMEPSWLAEFRCVSGSTCECV